MKVGLWPTHLHGEKNSRSGSILALLCSIFIGWKPDFRSVTLDLQQTPTARWERRPGIETLTFSLSFFPTLKNVGFYFLFLSDVSSCSSSIPLHKQSKALPRCKNIIAVCAECSYMYVTFLLNDEATCLLFKFVSPFFLQWAKTYICKILLLIRNRPEYFYCHGRFFFLSSVKNFYVFFLLFYEFKNRRNAFWVTGVSY